MKGIELFGLVVAAALSAASVEAGVYDDYLKAKPGFAQNEKAKKLFFKDQFGAAQFDARDIVEIFESTKDADWDVEKLAKLEKLVRHGIGNTGKDSVYAARMRELQAVIIEPLKRKHNLIVDGVHSYSTKGYQKPTDPLVLAELEKFQDRKLGLMVHFGIYAQLGIHESWPLVDFEAAWSRRLVDWQDDGEKFKQQYWSMNRSFNPVRFQPEVWAKIAKRDGFRYLVFTTKHHDGFCMYDSKYTDYKVTAPECPFSKNVHADIVKAVFDAFRAEGLSISCYFSKPDWHNEDYWENHGLGRKVDRMPTYEVDEHPEKWARYQQFVKNQILELIGGYGPIDCLWLDGGQVQRHTGLDIKIEEIVAEARKLRPGLIAVDRAVGNSCENIITPEQKVPPVALDVPWESCITMGTGFSYRYDDTFKSPRDLVHLLVDVVAKGGNLALNVAPGPDGRLPRPAIERMDAMGEWLRKNGEAIYSTRVLKPYRTQDWAFTQGKRGEKYAIRLWNEKDRGVQKVVLPKEYTGSVSALKHLASGKAILPGEGVYADDAADAFLILP